MAPRYLYLLIGVVVLLAGAVFVSQDEKDNKRQEKRFQKRIKKLHRLVEKIRKIRFKKEVEVKTNAKSKMREIMRNQIESVFPKERISALEKVLKKFGFFKEKDDLAKILKGFSSGDIGGGIYDSKTKRIYIAGGFNAGNIVHELTHALQDQNYDLESLPSYKNTFDNNDLVLAVTGLYEGDAKIVGMLSTFKKSPEKCLDLVEKGLRFLSSMMRMRKGDLPSYFHEYFIYHQVGGALFVLEILRQGGWEAVSKLYEDLPASTEQIIHPEKYYKDRDNPTIVNLPDLGDKLGEDWKMLDANVFGEFYIRIMFKEFKIKRWKNVAEGWDGDRYALYEGKDGKLLAVWFTTWDSQADAREFFNSYKDLLKRRYKDAKRSKDDKSITMEGPDGITGIQLKDKDVLILKDVPKERFKAIKDTLWNGIKKRELKKVQRIYKQKP